MTDQGVTITVRGSDGRILPSPRSRADRLRMVARTRWAAARTDLERLAAATDYARAAAASAGRAGVDPRSELDRATRAVWAAGEALAARIAATESRDG